jgi:hypothetical protein
VALRHSARSGPVRRYRVRRSVYVRAMTEPRAEAPEAEVASTRPEPATRWVSVIGTVLGLAIVVGVVGVAVFGLFAIYPDDVVEPTNANFLDNIFANRFVLFAARLV